jgi:Phosphomannomutase
MKGTVARTVATTHQLDKIAAKYELKPKETSVGFKYIGQCLLSDDCILGGEESGGLSVSFHVPEKDGILAALLVAEIRAVNRKPLRTILAEQNSEYGAVVSKRIDMHVDPQQKATILKCLETFSPDKIAGLKVLSRTTVDGLKLILENENWLLIRPSGTEPLFRLYVEALNEDVMKAIQEDVKRQLNI